MKQLSFGISDFVNQKKKKKKTVEIQFPLSLLEITSSYLLTIHDMFGHHQFAIISSCKFYYWETGYFKVIQFLALSLEKCDKWRYTQEQVFRILITTGNTEGGGCALSHFSHAWILEKCSILSAVVNKLIYPKSKSVANSPILWPVKSSQLQLLS